MFGKVHQWADQGGRALKNGLARAHGIVQHGIHFAGKVNDMYNVSKRLAAIALPHLEQYFPGVMPAGVKMIGNMDHARGQVMARASDVHDQILDHGRVFAQIRDTIPGARAYTG